MKKYLISNIPSKIFVMIHQTLDTSCLNVFLGIYYNFKKIKKTHLKRTTSKSFEIDWIINRILNSLHPFRLKNLNNVVLYILFKIIKKD